LRGKVQLQKEGASQSAFEGTIEVALTYPPGSADVRSLRGTIDGAYLYRVRGTQPMKLHAAIESRPE
jgi:hypothetical protein